MNDFTNEEIIETEMALRIHIKYLEDKVNYLEDKVNYDESKTDFRMMLEHAKTHLGYANAALAKSRKIEIKNYV